MHDEIVISLTNVAKVFKRYHRPVDRLKEILVPGKPRADEFWALRDINLTIPKGETLGVIGRNGSGKSTLLQIIAGTLKPTIGDVQVNGRISALLELGSGFNPEFTGRQNVFFNGRILGLSRQEVENRFDEIATFADIGDFIDQPVKTYSSGMFVRLAFAVAVHVEPDILIVDEALSVGDMFFQAKCLSKMQGMIDNGVTILFVSHDVGAVKSICRKAILLHHGEVKARGLAKEVTETYFAMKFELLQGDADKSRFIDPEPTFKLKESVPKEAIDHQPYLFFQENETFLRLANFQRIQNGKASFQNVILLDERDRPISAVSYGQSVTLKMIFSIESEIENLAFGYHIRNKDGVDVIYSDNLIEEMPISNAKIGDRYVVDWQFKVALMGGNYTIACILSIPINLMNGDIDCCDFVPIAAQFSVTPRQPSPLYGNVHWQNKVIVNCSRDSILEC